MGVGERDMTHERERERERPEGSLRQCAPLWAYRKCVGGGLGSILEVRVYASSRDLPPTLYDLPLAISSLSFVTVHPST